MVILEIEDSEEPWKQYAKDKAIIAAITAPKDMVTKYNS